MFFDRRAPLVTVAAGRASSLSRSALVILNFDGRLRDPCVRIIVFHKNILINGDEDGQAKRVKSATQTRPRAFDKRL
jgi:hypothetical protein